MKHDVSNSPLGMHLSMSVPLQILELKKNGGPTPDDFKRATGFHKDLAEKGDVLLFGSKKKGETAKMANEMTFAVAVLAFIPGGIKIFGQTFDAKNFKIKECKK